MTQRAITLRFLIPEALAVASGIIVLIGIVYFTNKYPTLIDRADANHPIAGNRGSVELSNSDVRLWRVHMLLQ